MGTIKVTGMAKRRVIADEISYRISITAEDVQQAKALSKVKEDTEVFLKELKDNGFDIRNIHLEEDNIRSQHYDRHELKTVTRTLQFRTGFDAAVSDFILSVIEEKKITAFLETEYSYSKEGELHGELLKEALLESRRCAEALAEANGQKVKYIESVTDDRYHEVEVKMEESADMARPMMSFKRNDLSSELSGKEIEREESVNAVWVIE